MIEHYTGVTIGVTTYFVSQLQIADAYGDMQKAAEKVKESLEKKELPDVKTLITPEVIEDKKPKIKKEFD
jgi:hypothetical protein